MSHQLSAVSSQRSEISGQKSGFLKRLCAKSRTLNARVLNDKGIALAMVLILAAISLSIMAALIYMLVGGTKTSGIQKRYKTALEAAIGGGEVAYQFIALRGQATDQNNFITSLTNAGLTNVSVPTTTLGTCITNTAVTLPDGRTCSSMGSYTGLATKLNLPTACWIGCNSSLTITPGTNTTYDIQFDLGTTTTYRVYAKIVDTVEGNSAEADEGLIKGGVVSANSGEVTVQSKPYLYTIEIDAENPTNPDERAKVSVLYQY